MFLSQEIDKKNCVKIIPKRAYARFCIKVVVLNRSYSATTQHVKPVKCILAVSEYFQSHFNHLNFKSFKIP